MTALDRIPVLLHDSDPVEHIYELHDMAGLPVLFHWDEVRRACACPTNWHENLEILLFISGSGTVICGNVSTPVTAGDICVIDSDVLHRVESEDTVQYYCLILDNGFCRQNGLHLESARFERCIRSEALAREYNKVAEAFLAEDDCREAGLRGAVLSFAVYLLRNHRLDGENVPLKISPGIRKAIGYIRAHFARALDVETLASVAGLSKYHFIREFKRVTGQTVITYINTVRIEQATRLLREGELSVADVAAACGFSGHSYFSKVFYRLKGVIPSELAQREWEARK